jgi:hypothetical protein
VSCNTAVIYHALPSRDRNIGYIRRELYTPVRERLCTVNQLSNSPGARHRSCRPGSTCDPIYASENSGSRSVLGLTRVAQNNTLKANLKIAVHRTERTPHNRPNGLQWTHHAGAEHWLAISPLWSTARCLQLIPGAQPFAGEQCCTPQSELLPWLYDRAAPAAKLPQARLPAVPTDVCSCANTH